MLQHQERSDAAALQCRKLAEQAALRFLLNGYLRETGQFDPRVNRRDGSRDQAFAAALPRTGKVILGRFSYFSLAGQHAYREAFHVRDMSAEDGAIPLGTDRLIDMLLTEVSCLGPRADRQARKREMLEQIACSIRRTSLYLEFASCRESRQEAALSYIGSEQSLRYGHTFHPTPKSSEGFTEEELAQYAPELGASFRLQYVAVSQELVEEQWIDPYEPLPETVREAVRRLGPLAQGYTAIPVHPWQWTYVQGNRHVQRLLEQGKLVDLGRMGAVVYPTSSVRTVWDPEEGMFYKLPLHVRITHFIRENTPEQVRRTMDAAVIVKRLSEEADELEAKEGLRILPELGYRTIRLNDVPWSEREQLMASFAVIYRQGKPLTGQGGDPCYALASLLEEAPGSTEPLLFTAIRQSAGGSLPDWDMWLSRYIDLTALPLLRLFAHSGISLEAHLQNSLLRLERGLPSRFYVRDLEGISVSAEHADRHGWTKELVSADSPVLYPAAEAWLRLQYYYVVNHLGTLVPTICRCAGREEAAYWQIVRNRLEQHRSEAQRGEPLHALLTDLLGRQTLPAKANFISRFQQRGETPDYVDIPNPISDSEVKR
ncbi:IucA/IucC family protein [Paenibacillus puerhi]|uniref:IucA/IucC family protein n=1 Tax=Paenibacillus puerhi TaxID=2692622 RepID=UPI00135896EC|nr:IucA/IucC family protein [Paenibacillus puerhi]